MSDSDSFINEVNDEVRRDQLYGYVRRYGWLAVLAILLLVGGAGWNEFSKSRAESLAQANGEALLTALEENDPEARAAALADVTVAGDSGIVADLITAASQQEAGDAAAAADTLSRISVGEAVPEVYRDLAALKRAMLDSVPLEERRQILDVLAAPGGSFALLAQEQLAYLDLEAGDAAAAIGRLRAIIEDANVTRGLRDRAQSMIVALGADLSGEGQTN